MKTRLSIIIVLCLIGISSVAQDANAGKDESSIILDNANIGFDPGETSISFKMNNLSLSKTNPKSVLWGVSAEGKNSEGVSSVFSSSEIVPSSQISLLFGYSWSSADQITDLYISESIADKKRLLELSTKFKTSIHAAIDNDIKSISNLNAKGIIRAAYDKALSAPSNVTSALESALKGVILDPENDATTDIEAAKLLEKYFNNNREWEEFKELAEKVKTRISNFDSKLLPNAYKRGTFYLHYGSNSTTYHLFKGWDAVSILNSFEKNTFKGNTAGFGLNFNSGNRWILGFRYTYEETNNLSQLSTTEYTVTINNTSGTATGSTQVKKTAYENNFKRAYLDNLDFDVLRYFPLGEKNVLLTDLYFKFNESSNEESIVSTTDIGISGSLFNGDGGKFIGGIYLEVPDIGQNIERKKPEPDLDPFYQRLSFGVFTKFSFTRLDQKIY